MYVAGSRALSLEWQRGTYGGGTIVATSNTSNFAEVGFPSDEPGSASATTHNGSFRGTVR
jgi:hypothetical protein